MANEPRKARGYKSPQNTKELLEQYASGERIFIGVRLSGADFRRADLCEADLRDANLIGANLNRVDLRNANVGNADLRGAKLIRVDLSNASLHNANLSDATLLAGDLRYANFRGANLYCVDLRDADLRGADLRDANLDDVNFYGADLSGTDLSGADLSNADLSGSNLHGANLRTAYLTRADLRGSDLTGADLSNTDLNGANLHEARVGLTYLINIDLSSLCETVPPLIHYAESYVDFNSILKSIHTPHLENFLVRTGTPAIAVQYMIESARAVSGSVFGLLRSTFISYGAPDEAFARRLYEALHGNGAKVFLFSEHAEPGERLHRMMRKGVNEHDRVVLVCSKASLNRKGVMNELEETLAREAREGGETYLIPIRLDDYVFTGWKPKREDIAQAVRDRVVADFEGADTDAAKFDAALSKLLRALRVKPGPLDPSGGARGGP